jgi:adenosylcobyric acid synthase
VTGQTPARGLMVCGTGSDSGKSTVVAGLCRVLYRRGLKVAPFKAQNMALNSAVTPEGHEIGRAQAAQAAAAGVEPHVAMNPVLLKPTDHRTSQVVVLGAPWAVLDAAEYQRAKRELWPIVTAQLARLRESFDVVICEGAGSPAEINLLEHDITNLRVAQEAGFPALLVGDIERGGVFASLFGTVKILPPALAATVAGFVINKFRGDPGLLVPGLAELEARTGVPTLGVLPWMDDAMFDSEDSLALSRLGMIPRDRLVQIDVAAIRFPRISNFTDLDALAMEPGIRLRLVDRPQDLGRPDLLVLPGSKATVADLDWMTRTSLTASVLELAAAPGTTVLGICGGYQMMGRRISDAVESPIPSTVDGLGMLPVDTTFEAEKITRRVSGRAGGVAITGYEIHHGRTPSTETWIEIEGGPEGCRPDGSRAEGHRAEGCRVDGGRLAGTSVHGLFENDGFRRAFLSEVAARSGVEWTPDPSVSFSAARERRFDHLAELLETHLDMEAVLGLIKGAAA